MRLSEQTVSHSGLNQLLLSQKLITDASEVHGIIAGMLAAGMPLESKEWLPAIEDFTNQKEVFPDECSDVLKELYTQTVEQLIDTDFSLSLLLPDDNAPVSERAGCLLVWVQGFLLGFGLYQDDLTKCSADVKEAMEDFSQIARMEEDLEETEESEQALFEILEYVRVSVMLCFSELGKGKTVNSDNSKNSKLH